MPPTVTLPDPRWDQAAAVCVACGYSLAGLTAPALCPECGSPDTGPQLVVGGVPTARSVMSGWRVAAMVLISVAAVFSPQILVAIGIYLSWWVTGAALLAGIAAVVGLVVTAPRSQGGKGTLIFSGGAVTLMPIGVEAKGERDASGATTRFHGDESVVIKRVSPVWAKLKIVRPAGASVFEAGIRCPEESEPMVREAISAVLEQARERTARPTP